MIGAGNIAPQGLKPTHIPLPQKPIILDCEEISMTYQIGLLVAEGALLVSDRQFSDPVLLGRRPCSPKIRVHEKENLAHCSAGDMLCEEFVKHVRKANRTLGFADRSVEDVRDVFIECTEKANMEKSRFRTEHPRAPCLSGGHTFVVYRGSRQSFLWSIKTHELNPNPTIVDTDSEALSAGASTTATFFMERYFHRVPKKMESLIPLAVHTVLMAEGEGVKGVQVGLFSRDFFGVLSDTQIKPLIRASKQLCKDVDAVVLKQLRRKDTSL